MELWIFLTMLVLLGVTMVVRPTTFAFWSVHRKPEVLVASRAVGALLLVATAVGLLMRFAR